MSKSPIAVFTRSRQTGLMLALASGEVNPYTFARDRGSERHLRVLVVDPNETELQLTIRQLGAAWPFARDLVAEVATNGVEAVEKIRRHVYAFVVVDWNLPRPDGTDVLQLIRAEGLRVPVIVISAQRRAAIASNLESRGAAFVNKRGLNPTRFLNAMAAAILSTQRLFGLAPAGAFQIRDRRPAHTVEGRFVTPSAQLFVRPATVPGEFQSPRLPARETPIGNRPVSSRGVKAARNRITVTKVKPSLVGCNA